MRKATRPTQRQLPRRNVRSTCSSMCAQRCPPMLLLPPSCCRCMAHATQHKRHTNQYTAAIEITRQTRAKSTSTTCLRAPAMQAQRASKQAIKAASNLSSQPLLPKHTTQTHRARPRHVNTRPVQTPCSATPGSCCCFCMHIGYAHACAATVQLRPVEAADC